MQFRGSIDTLVMRSPALPARRAGEVRRAYPVLNRVETVVALFSGLKPTLIRDVPYSGLYFMFYDQLKRR